MITRDNIKVERKSDFNTGRNYTMVSVLIDDKEYGVSYVDDASRAVAIPMLAEYVMKKEIGIIEHDIRMKVYEYEMAKDEK